ncbi:uncharacterized protein TNCV_3615611 [Trichonephila clavipes]|nr:uncharacterized protein TNCV_3615611 [Trichonephila clavipes]
MSSCRSLRGRESSAMMEAGWSAMRVARQLGRPDYFVRRCWDQWIRDMSFTRRPGSGCPRQTIRREDRHIVRNTHVQPTASSAAIRGTGSTFTRGPCVFSNHTKAPVRRHLGSTAPITCAALDAHPSTPPFGVVPRTRKLDCSGMEPGRL